MQIVVSANDSQWDELSGNGVADGCIRADEVDLAGYKEADAFVLLSVGSNWKSCARFKKPVLINAVTHTLAELDAPVNVLRINGWNGFIKRPVWEIAGNKTDRVLELAVHLNRKLVFVADEPGLVAASIISMIINEAYFALGDGVSSAGEIDTAMKLGTNYPFGPFEWTAAIGAEKVLELLRKLNTKSERYLPAPLLMGAAKENQP
jgi:3-hydroxybutyryl-CoA dehydrogenase